MRNESPQAARQGPGLRLEGDGAWQKPGNQRQAEQAKDAKCDEYRLQSEVIANEAADQPTSRSPEGVAANVQSDCRHQGRAGHTVTQVGDGYRWQHAQGNSEAGAQHQQAIEL